MFIDTEVDNTWNSNITVKEKYTFTLTLENWKLMSVLRSWAENLRTLVRMIPRTGFPNKAVHFFLKISIKMKLHYTNSFQPLPVLLVVLGSEEWKTVGSVLFVVQSAGGWRACAQCDAIFTRLRRIPSSRIDQDKLISIPSYPAVEKKRVFNEIFLRWPGVEAEKWRRAVQYNNY